MRILRCLVVVGGLLVAAAALAQEGGLTLAPGPNQSIVCSGSALIDGVTYSCDDIRALAAARANGADTGPTLPAEVELAVSTLAAAQQGGAE